MKYDNSFYWFFLPLPEKKEWLAAVELFIEAEKALVDYLRMCSPGRYTEMSGKKPWS